MAAPSLSFLLSVLGRHVREDLEAGLAARRLSFRHLSALGHLARDPGLSYSELARRGGVTPQSMQATLRHLEDLTAVERRTEPGRGRRSQLHVTAHGHALLGEGREVMRAVDRQLAAGLPAEDHGELARTLLRLLRTYGGRGKEVSPGSAPDRSR